MTVPLRLVMDADGVFVDFVGGVLRDVKELSGVDVPLSALPDWDIFAAIETQTFAGMEALLRERIEQPMEDGVEFATFENERGIAPIREIIQRENAPLLIDEYRDTIDDWKSRPALWTNA